MSNDSKKHQQEDDDAYAPVWLSEDYDETHREEAAPLFGSGTLNLRDENHDKNTDEENQKQTNPAIKALNHIKNAFHLTTSGDEADNNNKKMTKKEELSSSRVGQNLLLRDDLTPKNSNNDIDDDNNKTHDAVVDDNNPFADTNSNNKKKKKKKDDNAVVDETTKLFDFKKDSIDDDEECDDDDKYRFWTSKPKKKKTLLDDIPREQLKPHRPIYQPILYMFNLLQGLSIIGSISIIIAQLLPIYYIHPRSDIIIQIGFITLCLKCYIIIFSLLFIHTEIDISFLKPIPLLQGFLSRGFIYTFIGIICINESYSDRMKYILLNRNSSNGATPEFDWLGIYMEISSWYILSIGFIYMILGTCCLKRLRDKLKQNEILLWKDYRDKLKLWKIQQYNG